MQEAIFFVSFACLLAFAAHFFVIKPMLAYQEELLLNQRLIKEKLEYIKNSLAESETFQVRMEAFLKTQDFEIKILKKEIEADLARNLTLVSKPETTLQPQDLPESNPHQDQ